MKHYVYRLTCPDGNFYFGSRSSKKTPTDDPYMGSGRWPRLCQKLGTCLRKEIVGTFPSRIEASTYEVDLIIENEDNPLMRNIAKSIQCPAVGSSTVWKSPFRIIIDSGIIALPAKAVMLWVELVGANRGNGISSRVLAIRAGCSIAECDRLLSMISGVNYPGLPKITQSGNIWNTFQS